MKINKIIYEFNSKKYKYLNKAWEASRKDIFEDIFDIYSDDDNGAYQKQMAKDCHREVPDSETIRNQKYIRGIAYDFSKIKAIEGYEYQWFNNGSFSIYISISGKMLKETLKQIKKAFKKNYKKYSKLQTLDIDITGYNIFKKVLKYNVLDDFNDWFIENISNEVDSSVVLDTEKVISDNGVYHFEFDLRTTVFKFSEKSIEKALIDAYLILRHQSIDVNKFDDLEAPWSIRTDAFIGSQFVGFETKGDALNYMSKYYPDQNIENYEQSIR